MDADRSEGWEAIAGDFMAVRAAIGAVLVRDWATRHLPPGAEIVDVGCGSGVPISRALADGGFRVFGLDASATLVSAFRQNLPDAPAAVEAAQESAFFDHRFDAAVAVGLLFLLSEEDQGEVIGRVAGALRPGGRLLFSAPRECCEWQDLLTGRSSRSLGHDAYAQLLEGAGMQLDGCLLDEGENNYFDAVKAAV